MRLFIPIVLLLFAVPLFSEEPPDVTMHRFQVAEKDNSGWHHAESTLGSFEASLPCPFNDFSLQPAGSKDSPFAMHTVGCVTPEGNKFTVAEISGVTKDPDLDSVLKNFANAEVKDVDRSPYAGYKAITFEVLSTETGAFIRYIKHGSNLTVVTLEYKNEERKAAVKLKGNFFNSLSFK